MTTTFPPEAHPLDAARLRHQRGLEGLVNVQNIIEAFARLHRGEFREDPPLAYLDADTNNWIPLPFYRRPPLKLVFEVSEMVYNLKVALDYSTYALFEKALEEGRIAPSMFESDAEFSRFERSVQFPIMDTPEKFSAWARKHRQWLCPTERAVFKAAQPYRRQLIRFLGDDYHNLDKHRGIQEFSVEVDLSSAVLRKTEAFTTAEHVLEWEGIPVYGFETKESFPPNRPVSVYARGSVEIFLPGRLPVVPTLKVLESEVGSLIDALSLAFERT
jgi:hypothetical protein